MPSVQESQYLYDLQLQRAQKLENNAFEQIAADITPPKKGKYIFAGVLAIVGDIIDLLDITGIGEIVTLIADFIIDPLLVWLGFRMNKEVKKKEQASEGLNEMISSLNQKIEGYRNAIQMARNAKGKLKSLKKTTGKTKIKVALKKPKAVTKRGILGKIFLGELVDFIPLAELYPARTHSVWSSYRTEKAAYNEALEIIGNFLLFRGVELEEKTEYIDSLLEGQADFEEEQELPIAA